MSLDFTKVTPEKVGGATSEATWSNSFKFPGEINSQSRILWSPFKQNNRMKTFFRHVNFQKLYTHIPFVFLFKEATGGCAPLKWERKSTKRNKWCSVQLSCFSFGLAAKWPSVFQLLPLSLDSGEKKKPTPPWELKSTHFQDWTCDVGIINEMYLCYILTEKRWMKCVFYPWLWCWQQGWAASLSSWHISGRDTK